MNDLRRLTAEEGLAALDAEGEVIHTTPSNLWLGAYWSREEVVEAIGAAAADNRLVEAPRGSVGWRMGHRIAVLKHYASGSHLLIATREGYGEKPYATEDFTPTGVQEDED